MESNWFGAVILFFLRIFAWVLCQVPSRFREAFGKLLGTLIRWTGWRSKVVQENLEHAGLPGDLFRQAYSHLGQLILEVVMLLGPFRQFVVKSSTLEGVEHWRKAKAQGKGVLFLSSHVGNWEIMAATGAIHGGMDLMIVTKHLKPEWLHRAIEKSRKACGVLGAYEPRTLKDVLRHLKSNGTVGFVLDQYAGPPVGVRVPFFGVSVGTSSALAILAKRTGAVVLPVVNFRTPDGRMRVVIREPVSWISRDNPDHELAVNTARYVECVETDVRSHPDQWLWVHRRFKGDLTPISLEDAHRARSGR